MSIKLIDNFTGTNNTNLEDHAPDLGGTWVRASGTSGHNLILFSNTLIKNQQSTPGSVWYYNDVSVPEDMTNQASFLKVNSDTDDARLTITCRQDASANTHYGLRYDNSAHQFSMFARVSGAATVLGAVSVSLSPNEGHTARLMTVTNNTEVIVRGYIDGALLLSANASGSNAIFGGFLGAAAVHTSSDGIRLDSLEGGSILDVSGVSPGNVWSSIWAPDVWAEGVWFEGEEPETPPSTGYEYIHLGGKVYLFKTNVLHSLALPKGLQTRTPQGTAGPDVFVDSNAADDSGDGLSSSTPKKTISAALALLDGSSSKVLGLARDGVWRESVIVSTDNITLQSYGTGARPRITGTDIIANWDQANGDNVVAQFPNKSFVSLNIGNVASQNIQGNEWTATEDIILTKVAFWGRQQGSIVSGDIFATVYASASAAPGPLLATSDTIDATIITTDTGGERIEFNFSTPLTVTNGTNIVICCEKTFNTSSGAYIKLFGATATTEFPTRWRFTPWTKLTDVVFYMEIIETGDVANTYETIVTTTPRVVLFDGEWGYQVTALSDIDGPRMWHYDTSSDVLTVFASVEPTATGPVIEASQRSKVCTIDGANNTILKDIVFDGGSSYGVFLFGATSATQIQRCAIEKNFSLGFVPENATSHSNIILASVSTAFNGAHGLYINSQCPNWLIDGWTSYRDGIVATDFDDGSGENDFGGAIKILDLGGTTRNGELRNFDISFSGRRDDGLEVAPNLKGFGVWFDLSYGPTALYPNGGHRMHHGIIHDCGDAGLFLEKSDYVTIDHLVTYANLGDGVRFDTDAGQRANTGHLLHHITSWGNGATGFTVRGTFNHTSDMVLNNTIRDSIATENGGANFYAYWGGENDGDEGSGNIYENNNFGPEANNFVGYGEDNFLDTYAALESAYGSDMDNVEGDPLLDDPDNGDFTLEPGSPCIGTASDGTDLGGV